MKKRVITCENHQSSKLTLSLNLHCPSPWLVRESVKCKSFTLKRFFGGKNYLVTKLGTLSVGDDERISTKLKIVATASSSFFNLIWLYCWTFLDSIMKLYRPLRCSLFFAASTSIQSMKTRKPRFLSVVILWWTYEHLLVEDLDTDWIINHWLG